MDLIADILADIMETNRGHPPLPAGRTEITDDALAARCMSL